MDDNIDTNLNNIHNRKYKIKDLYNLLQQHLTENNLTLQTKNLH